MNSIVFIFFDVQDLIRSIYDLCIYPDFCNTKTTWQIYLCISLLIRKARLFLSWQAVYGHRLFWSVCVIHINWIVNR